MTKGRNIMKNWDVAINGDAKGRNLSAERSTTGI